MSWMTARPWRALLALPCVAVLWVPFFNAAEPAWLGLPFFYWFQLAWIPLSAVVIGVVYGLDRRAARRGRGA